MKRCIWLVTVGVLLGSSAAAQEPRPGKAAGSVEPPAGSRPESREALYKEFAEQMRAVKLVGRFTVIGRDTGSPAQDEYTIHKVEKLPEGDKWLIHARIKYGQHDLTVPLPLDVKWAGSTPVITLDELTIPTLGTFSARVVIDGRKYAGTWQHDKVGGHMFGVIEQLPDTERPAATGKGPGPGSR